MSDEPLDPEASEAWRLFITLAKARNRFVAETFLAAAWRAERLDDDDYAQPVL